MWTTEKQKWFKNLSLKIKHFWEEFVSAFNILYAQKITLFFSLWWTFLLFFYYFYLISYLKNILLDIFWFCFYLIIKKNIEEEILLFPIVFNLKMLLNLINFFKIKLNNFQFFYYYWFSWSYWKLVFFTDSFGGPAPKIALWSVFLTSTHLLKWKCILFHNSLTLLIGTYFAC